MLLNDADVESNIHIDFVPMVDVLFNLLIFFLLATTIAQVEREINVALPFAGSAAPISAQLRELVINIDESGRVLIGGKAVAAEELRAVVKSAVQANPNQKVSVRGDRRTAYSNVVQALDICKSAGVQQPYLDTVLDR
ncbi:MAG: biopolymer transporter ExbD [Planctomycetes bacterium]|nr:biopolymer transporter ExbD [Planctomycetota bacterium]